MPLGKSRGVFRLQVQVLLLHSLNQAIRSFPFFPVTRDLLLIP